MQGLTTDQIILLTIAGLTILGLLTSRFTPDVVAVLSLLALGITGVIPVEDALAGFSRPAVMTIIGLFIITSTLERTGVVQWIAGRLARLAGNSEGRVMTVLMVAGALLSLLMNTIAAGAVLLPAAVQVAHGAGVRTSKILLPLAFGTLLGGMSTLLTTSNIIVSGILQAQGAPALTMLDFLPVGMLTTLMGVGYMLLLGKRWLPAHESAVREALPRPNLLDTYRLAERLWEVRILPDSPLVGCRLVETTIGAQYGTTVIAIWHGQAAIIPPGPDDVISADDILLILGREERVRALESLQTTMGRNGRYKAVMQGFPVQLTEVVIGPRSAAIGQTLKQLRFRSKFGLTSVGIWREGRSYLTDVGDFALRAGDAILMVGPDRSIETLAQEPGYIIPDYQPPTDKPTHKAPWAIGITVLVLLLSIFRLLPTAEAMLAGAVGLILTGCLTAEEAYQAIEWRVVVLIAGLAPLGTALVTTGLTEQIGALLTGVVHTIGPLTVLALFYLATVLLSQGVGGQVAALIIGPIAVNAAIAVGMNPVPIGVAVAMACSCAFLTPIAHPVNILMMGPGGYTARDFFRVGLGMLSRSQDSLGPG